MLINMIMIRFKRFIEGKPAGKSNLMTRGEVVAGPSSKDNMKKDLIVVGDQISIDTPSARETSSKNTTS